jgi:hypothetical protein
VVILEQFFQELAWSTETFPGKMCLFLELIKFSNSKHSCGKCFLGKAVNQLVDSENLPKGMEETVIETDL